MPGAPGTYQPLLPTALDERTEAGSPRAGANARRSGLLGAGGRRAFIIEAMLLLAFLGLSLALILQLFAASSRISRMAHDDSMLHLAANNAMQVALVDSQPPLGQQLFFDEQASPCAEEDAHYAVSVRAEGSPCGPGTMFDITAHASPAGDPDAQGFSLRAQHYVPHASSASASSEASASSASASSEARTGEGA